jgi:DNA ligase-associated metallophosphoesterase
MLHATTAPRMTETATAVLSVASVPLVPLVEGALWWPDERTLIVSDLHLEKGSSFARRGQMLPPYDTVATLRRLGSAIARVAPARIIALGDSFHDRQGGDRLCETDRLTLRTLTAATEWIWIAGNHDPEPPRDLGGWSTHELAIGPLTFRHEPRPGAQPGEVAGHLHPAARLIGRGRSIRRRCFAADGSRLVMPAFGALAGGLNVRDAAFRPLFAETSFRAWMLGDTVYPIAGRRLADD